MKINKMYYKIRDRTVAISIYLIGNKKLFPIIFLNLLVVLYCFGNLYFHPIKNLFVDDWIILKNFSLDNYGFNQINMNTYNSNPLIFSRVFYIFTTNLLGLDISTTALILFASYLMILSFFAISVTREYNNKNLACAGIILIGLNLNQYQNFTMPICWPWILSLMLFYLAFLISINYKDISILFFLVLVVLIAPQVFSLGFIIPIGLLLINSFSILLNRFSFRKIILVVASLVSILLSYYLSIKGNEESPQKIGELFHLIDNPIRIVLFLLSSFGAPFTPASEYASAISITFGILIAVILLIFLKNCSMHKKISHRNLIIYGIIFHLLQIFARYNGSLASIKIVNQPRYTTGALILLMGVYLGSFRYATNRIHFYVIIGLLTIMTFSGLKTSSDFIDTRFNQSERIENCIFEYGLKNEFCLDILNPGTEILSESEFSDAIDYILNHRS